MTMIKLLSCSYILNSGPQTDKLPECQRIREQNSPDDHWKLTLWKSRRRTQCQTALKKARGKKANCRKKHQAQQGWMDRENMKNMVKKKVETCKLRTWHFIELKWKCNHNFGRKTKNKIRIFFPPTDAERCRRYTLRSSSPSSLLRRNKKPSCFSEEAERRPPRWGGGEKNKLFSTLTFKKKKVIDGIGGSLPRLAWRCKPPRLGRRPCVAPSQARYKKRLVSK